MEEHILGYGRKDTFWLLANFMIYYKTKWDWTDQINLRSLSSGQSMGHTQGIIRNKKNVALVSYIQILYKVVNHSVQTTYLSNVKKCICS